MREDIIPTSSIPWETPPIDAWAGVFEIKTDPNYENRVYVVAYGPGKGLYRSDDQGTTWTKIYNNDKMRGVAIAPYNSDIIYASSSHSYHSGGYDPNSVGFKVSYDAGNTWQDANDGLAWTHGGKMDIEHNSQPSVWAWSPGVGIQHSSIPNYITSAHIVTSPSSIEIYPNPFSDFIIVDGDFLNFEIRILNSLGQVVEDLTNLNSPLKINLNNLSNGLHFIHIKNLINQNVSIHKIVKAQ